MRKFIKQLSGLWKPGNLPSPPVDPPVDPPQTSIATVYGPGIGADTMANLIVGGPDVNLFSHRFRAEQTSTVTTVRTIIKTGSGYSAGTGGTIRISLEADDGTGKPAGWYVNGSAGTRGGTGASLGYVDFTDTGTTNQNLRTFSVPGSVVSGTLYHLVYSNVNSSPTSNYTSINSTLNFGTVLVPRQPKFADEDYGVLLKVNAGSWGLMGNYTPVVDIGYGNSAHQGNSYQDPEMSGSPNITGANSMARERFTVSGANRTVTTVGVRVAKNSGSGSGNLVVRLEDSNGTLIDSASISTVSVPVYNRTADSNAGIWVTGTFSQPQTLISGSTYNLRLSTDASTSLWVRGIQKGSGLYGYSTSTVFSDGYCQMTTDGSTWVYVSGLNNQDGDLPIYLTEAPLWSTGFESGVLYDGSNYVQATAETEPANAAYPDLVTSPVHSGTYAARHTILAGGRRCERYPDGYGWTPHIVEGDDLWFSQWVRTNNLGYTDWQVVTQWKNFVYGTPPLALCIEAGYWKLIGGGSYPGSLTEEPPYQAQYNSTTTIGPHTNDTWFHFVWHILFSSNPAIGTVDCWMDGVQKISGFHPPGGTKYPTGDTYMKYGYYRSTSITTPGYIYHDDLKIGLTSASVGGTN